MCLQEAHTSYTGGGGARDPGSWLFLDLCSRRGGESGLGQDLKASLTGGPSSGAVLVRRFLRAPFSAWESAGRLVGSHRPYLQRWGFSGLGCPRTSCWPVLPRGIWKSRELSGGCPAPAPLPLHHPSSQGHSSLLCLSCVALVTFLIPGGCLLLPPVPAPFPGEEAWPLQAWRPPWGQHRWSRAALPLLLVPPCTLRCLLWGRSSSEARGLQKAELQRVKVYRGKDSGVR